MKKNIFKSRTYWIITLVAVIVVGVACGKKFLNQTTTGLITPEEAATKKGAQNALIGAYAALKGSGWEGGGMNWVYGSIVAGEANKGSDAGDQADIVPIQTFSELPTNNYFDIKWKALYEGVARTNLVIRILQALTAKDITDADKTQMMAEARFLRGFYHFEAKKMWNNVPWVDETITYADKNYKLPNNVDIWPKIMEDLDFARKNLVAVPSAVGRVNKWAAEAYYAKGLLYQGKYADALPIFTNVINNGVNSKGDKFGLASSFFANFNADSESVARKESVFAYEASINDGSTGLDANYDQILNFPYTGNGDAPGGCCGFFQPTFELANSFRTVNGLPLLNGAYKNAANELKTDMGIDSKDPFTPDPAEVDPRLDWTVGRRGVPYLDWGNHIGSAWVRLQAFGGPYSPKKNVYYKSQEKKLTDNSSWTSGLTATNYKHMRFADLLLMAAECEVEAGSLETARTYVNMIRNRAADPSTWVPGSPAVYKISPYTTPFADKAAGRTAVRFERKLELAMEGHRFFDLVRWGIADTEINAFLAYEKQKLSVYGPASFVKGKHEYFPIPQNQIDMSSTSGTSSLKQNAGY